MRVWGRSGEGLGQLVGGKNPGSSRSDRNNWIEREASEQAIARSDRNKWAQAIASDPQAIARRRRSDDGSKKRS